MKAVFYTSRSILYFIAYFTAYTYQNLKSRHISDCTWQAAGNTSIREAQHHPLLVVPLQPFHSAALSQGAQFLLRVPKFTSLLNLKGFGCASSCAMTCCVL